MYIEDHFDKLEAHRVKYGSDFGVVLGEVQENDGGHLHHGAWVHAMDRKPLTATERKALARSCSGSPNG